MSIITPSLNQGAFIADAIDSVFCQTESSQLEHIVVDGGSTDATQAVFSRYRHLTVLHDPGLGQSHAVNLGLRAASGSVIGWLNADDRYVPGALHDARRALDEHSEAGLVYGNCDFIDQAGRVIGHVRPGPFDLGRMLSGFNPIPQPAVFMRAVLLDQIGFLDERLHYVMDYELWLRAAQVTRLVWIDSTWAQFRKHPTSKTVSREHAFWPEQRAVARAYGGPFFSEAWRQRTVNRTYPRVLLASLREQGFGRRQRFSR